MSVSFESFSQLELTQLQVDFAENAASSANPAVVMKAYAAVCAALKTASLVLQHCDFGPSIRDKEIWEGIKKTAMRLKDKIERDNPFESEPQVTVSPVIFDKKTSANIFVHHSNPATDPAPMLKVKRPHVKDSERVKIAEMFERGMSINEIAEATGRKWATVKRALDRYTGAN